MLTPVQNPQTEVTDHTEKSSGVEQKPKDRIHIQVGLQLDEQAG